MSLSIVESCSEELKGTIENVVRENSNSQRTEAHELVTNVTLYVIAHSLDVRTYLFDEQYAYLGTTQEKMKQVVNTTIDFLFRLLNHPDFTGVSLQAMENALKKSVFEYLEQKINDSTLTKETYQDFIYYLQSSYDLSVILDILRMRISDNHELREEFKAVLEYMTLLDRNQFEEEEVGRIQHAINFRLNMLKNYNKEYFCKNFFLLRNQARVLPQEYESHHYFYPEEVTKEFKNLVLSIERGEAQSHQVQHEARNAIRRQLELIRKNQEKLQTLSSSQPDNAQQDTEQSSAEGQEKDSQGQ